jgi:hypothetical protein
MTVFEGSAEELEEVDILIAGGSLLSPITISTFIYT